jgi:uncharacterized cupin superfamily protein
MARRPNVFDPEFDSSSDRPGFAWRRAQVGSQAGARQLGASLYHLDPGESTFPTHWHHANEELLIVVAGTATLVGAGREEELAAGDVVAFPVGPEGTHRIENRGEAPCDVLLVSTLRSPEVVEYPDSGKVLVHDWFGEHPSSAPPRPLLVNRPERNLGLFEED